MKKYNYGLFLAGLITEEEMREANEMDPSGETQMAGPQTAPLGNNTGEQPADDEDDSEIEELNAQMQRVIGKLLTLIGKMKNKQKGYIVLHTIGQAVQTALKLSDYKVKNAVIGNLPSLQNSSPPAPPMAPNPQNGMA